MHDEAVAAFAHDGVDHLFVLLRAEGRENQGLRFPTREERGTVGARQHRLTDFDGAHRAGVAAVDTGFTGQNVAADDLGFHFKEDAVHFVHVGFFGPGGFGVLHEGGFDEFVDFAQLVVAILLAADRISFREPRVGEFVDARDQRFVLRGRLPIPSGLAGFFDEFVDGVDGDLHFLVAEHHGVQHRFFRETIRFRFHHQHGAFGTGDDKVELALMHFRQTRVADEVVVDVTHAAGTDRALEGNAGDGERGGSADHGSDIGIDVGIDGQNVNDDLNFVKESVREQGADRTVDQTAREGFLFGRTAFTLKEPAGELTRGVGLFNVVDRQGEEVLAGLGFLLGDDRGEHHRVVHGADHGTRGLAGDFTRRERHVVIAETEALGDLVEHRHSERILRLTCPNAFNIDACTPRTDGTLRQKDLI